jgi:hypothetical protein
VIWPSPGQPAHPIVIPLPPDIWPPDGKPEHPIVLPPPGAGVPPSVWPSPGFPAHPIVIPPQDPDRARLVEWHTAWAPATGWIVVGTPVPPTPAPSK